MDRLKNAWTRFVSAVREDHATMQRYHDRYQSTGHVASLGKDLVERVGFQMMASYRVMRFFHEAGVPLAPKIASRAIRLVYGSDIHWEAEIEPGVVIVHGMGMAISRSAHVGKGSILFQNITLAESTDSTTRAVGAPQIGQNVHIGPGSSLIGPITVGSGTKIVAGSTLLQSIPEGSRVEAPAPRIVPRRAKGELGAPAQGGGARPNGGRREG
jgi:serine O-acetyltransferase